jgi:hypothetical protein
MGRTRTLLNCFFPWLARSYYHLCAEIVKNTEIAYKKGYIQPSNDDLPGGSDYHTPRVDTSDQCLDDERNAHSLSIAIDL